MQVRALEPGQRREAELLLARARSYLARLTLELEPELATVLMDGVPVKPDGGRTLVVPVGDHVLEFRAPGRLSEKRLIKVSGGEERTLHVVLPSLDAPPASSAKTAREQTSQPATAASSEHAPLYKKAWLWVVVGAVVAGAAAGAAVALTRNKNHGRDTSDEPNPPTLVAP
jgi:hypothetical protein